MKKVFFVSALLAVLNACQTNVSPEDIKPFDYPVEVTFRATESFRSKTVLNHESILWESSDQIKVLWGENRFNIADAKPYNSGASAEFYTTVEEASAYYGVYPASAVSSLINGVVSVSVPEVQSGVFADANIAVAKADNELNMSFRHLVSFLEFTIDRTGTLTFSAGSSNPVAGVVSVKGFDESGLPVYDTSGGVMSVTLDVKSSGTYYIALLPNARLDKLSFRLYDGKSVFTAVSDKSFQMSPGKLIGLGNITDRFVDGNSFGATVENMVIDEYMWEF